MLKRYVREACTCQTHRSSFLFSRERSSIRGRQGFHNSVFSLLSENTRASGRPVVEGGQYAHVGNSMAYVGDVHCFISQLHRMRHCRKTPMSAEGSCTSIVGLIFPPPNGLSSVHVRERQFISVYVSMLEEEDAITLETRMPFLAAAKGNINICREERNVTMASVDFILSVGVLWSERLPSNHCGSREQNASPLWNWIATGSREKNGASSLMGCCTKNIKIADATDCTVDGGYSHSKPCIQCGDLQNWRLLRLVTQTDR
eukprot:Gb_20106 [translate_table: standard]